MIWLLALVVVFAPMQAAVSAIDMLQQDKTHKSHCQHDMAGQMGHADMGHGDCCHNDNGSGCADNCSSCTQCMSLHAMLLGQLHLAHPLNHPFEFQNYSLASGITGSNEYRPPRSFS